MTLQQAVTDLCLCPFIHYDIKKEFKKIDSDIKLGISVTDAFQNMADRNPTEDVQDVASAVKMQSIVGGSEAEVIEYISNNISSRIMLKKEIKTIFANIKMTVLGMEVLPILMIVGIFISSPSYFAPCWESWIGKIGMILSFIMMIIGTFVTQKMLKSVKGA
jgi:tight adherence protein B